MKPLVLLLIVVLWMGSVKQAKAQEIGLDWMSIFSCTGNCNTPQLCHDSVGNTYLAAAFVRTISYGSNVLHSRDSSLSSLMIAKFDTAGSILWLHSLPFTDPFNYGGIYDPTFTKLKITPDNKFIYCVGNLNYNGYDYGYMAVVRPDGTFIRYRDTVSSRWNNDLAFDSLDNVYICGYTTNAGQNSLLEKIDTNGHIVWSYVSTDTNKLYSCFITHDTLYLAGQFMNTMHISDTTAGALPTAITSSTSNGWDLCELAYSFRGHLLDHKTAAGIVPYTPGGTPQFSAVFGQNGVWHIAYSPKDIASGKYLANVNNYSLGLSSHTTFSETTPCYFLAPMIISNSRYSDEGAFTYRGQIWVSSKAFRYNSSSVVDTPSTYYAGSVIDSIPSIDFSFDKMGSMYAASAFNGTISYNDASGIHYASSIPNSLYVWKYHNCRSYSPTVIKKGDTLYCSDTTPGLIITWYYNGNPISSAHGLWFRPHADGSYSVKVSDVWSCNTTSPTLYVVTGIETISEQDEIKLYPNPASTFLIVQFQNPAARSIEIQNVVGQTILTERSTAERETLDIQGLCTGLYLLKINSGNQSAILKFIKQ